MRHFKEKSEEGNEEEWEYSPKLLEDAKKILAETSLRIAEKAKRMAQEGEPITEDWLFSAYEELENWAGMVYMSPLYYFTDRGLYLEELEDEFLKELQNDLKMVGDFIFSEEDINQIQRFITNFRLD